MKYINLKALLACVMAISLTSCGGKITATIGGTVSGLSGNTTVTLQNNGGDNVVVNANGTFAFPTQLEAGQTYVASVLTQPVGETCVVENAIGVVEQSIGNVNSIAVICTVTITASNSVLGTVTGLPLNASVVLTNEGTNSVTVTRTSATASTISFVFPAQAIGSAYDVEIQSETGTTCSNSSFTHNKGIIPSDGSAIPLVALACP
jgi:hypothetical protein